MITSPPNFSGAFLLQQKLIYTSNMAKIEWVNSLAKKPASSGVLLFNDKKELLIVKPTYREGWQLPGGVLEHLESPSASAIRETQEEIGVTIDTPKLIGISYGSTNSEEGAPYDVFYFLFHGGTLTEDQISKIKLQEKELSEFKFLPVEQALPLFNKRITLRVERALKAFEENTVDYAEYGLK
jgi:8-oxo-dGTP pyrophosphatase MutT (NUDIX family)